jgi:DNA-binding response OmpR family regulator
MHKQAEQIRVLIVDDEEQMTAFLAAYLANEGYAVHEVHSGQQALDALQQEPGFDLVLLDWMMPGMNGLDVCRALRRFSDIPVIFLTARSDEIDTIVGLEIGADDYMTKPCSLRELEVRIRVVLRRRMSTAADGLASPGSLSTIQRGRLEIDIERYAVTLSDEPVALTPTEFKLLMTLAQHPGRVYSRLDLLEIALGEEYGGYERSVDTHIRNLRRKIEQDYANPAMIVTVHGIGYKFSDAPW